MSNIIEWYDDVKIIKKDDQYFNKVGLVRNIFNSGKSFSIGIGDRIKVYDINDLEKVENK